MFEILPESQGDLIAIKASGKLTADDYEKFLVPKLDKLFAAYGKLRMLVLFSEDFSGWAEVSAAWDDAMIGLQHPRDFKKLALVGAPQWVEWGMRFFALFVPGHAKPFSTDCYDDAIAWLELD
jgi:hypothetical protein